jgi:L-fuculose-phosphate aldolase
MAKYGLPGSDELGEKIASVFEQGYSTVMLENHGTVVGAKDLFSAFMAFETLEFCARLEIEAKTLGEPVSLTERNVELSKAKQDIHLDEFIPARHTSTENEARREMCTLIRRAYDQRLFTSTQGTFSQRLEGDSFLITPYMEDRRYLGIEDLVLVNGKMKEAGKLPSRSLPLHRLIYDTQPHVNSIIIAHPPNIMAFAVTGQPFDSRIIPESYLLLRDVPKVPFGSSFIEPERVAAMFVPRTPVVLVENDCVIVAGSSLLNAFDRLEVAEYSARAIIAAKGLGDIVAIGKDQISDIDRAFGLD